MSAVKKEDKKTPLRESPRKVSNEKWAQWPSTNCCVFLKLYRRKASATSSRHGMMAALHEQKTAVWDTWKPPIPKPPLLIGQKGHIYGVPPQSLFRQNGGFDFYFKTAIERTYNYVVVKATVLITHSYRLFLYAGWTRLVIFCNVFKTVALTTT